MHRIRLENILPIQFADSKNSIARFSNHTRLPLYRNAYAWMVSTGISSGLGVIYWIIAARFYSSDIVGLSAASISAMIFLSGVSQLNLGSALVRFIPTAGHSTQRLVSLTYIIPIILAVILGILLLIPFRPWVSRITFLSDSRDFTIWFVSSILIWCIFALQDTALTGLRDAVWVPVENISYGVVKILLLVLLAQSLPRYGIFISWIVPVIATILPINWLIFRQLIPKHVQETQQKAEPLIPHQVARFVVGNFIGSLFLLASARLLPVLITNRAGAQAGAYFFMAWTIANSLKLITTNMTMSLTVESARDQGKLATHSSQFLYLVAGIFLPLIALVFFTAPFLLRFSGNEYSAEGTTLLRLLALSVIPSLVTVVFVSTAQVQHRIAAIVIVQASFSILVVGLTLVLLPKYGITGVGLAFLISETTLAAILFLTQLKPILQRQPQNLNSVKSED